MADRRHRGPARRHRRPPGLDAPGLRPLAGAASQAFTDGSGAGLFGTGELRSDLYKTFGWLLNLAVAELVIRRPSRCRRTARVGRAVVVAQR
jgi:hypothetical protein